ncbi:MAG: DUF1846 family protein [Candidatus Lokiarchaeota archaeon]|nr:DUF1846 family protein [Candidatus Lokiarchaeota archaeon]
MKKVGFNNEKYLKEQTEYILERAGCFDNKLYLEFGGKLIFDYHASRVLPGFDPNSKIRLLQRLKDNLDIVIAIYAGDIERRKMRADFGITYDANTLKLIDDLREWDLDISAVVITRYEEQPAVLQFLNKLKRRNIQVYTHRAIKGYPTDVDLIVSDEGYGSNEFIQTGKPIVVVTGPGPGSGKMATCLSQVYHEHKRGNQAGYAKFETFPIWNLPLKHPVNITYESATADLGDYNQVDPFYLEATGEIAINYNRDIEVFPIVRRIMKRIMGSDIYNSPTEMGVNRAGFAIIDDNIVRKACKQELIRRFLRYRCEYAMGLTERKTVQRSELLMKELNLTPLDRIVVGSARDTATEAEKKGKGSDGIYVGSAIELPNKKIVTGKNSSLMHAASALVLNSIKVLANIPDEIHLLSPNIIESIRKLKSNILNNKKVSLNLGETLIALSISADFNPTAKLAMEKLKELKDCEIHITHMPTPGDEDGLRRLGVNITSDPNFSSKRLFLSA